MGWPEANKVERCISYRDTKLNVPYDRSACIQRCIFIQCGFLLIMRSQSREAAQGPAHRIIHCEIRSQDLENPPPRCYVLE
jgi:hypothetical protein